MSIFPAIIAWNYTELSLTGDAWSVSASQENIYSVYSETLWDLQFHEIPGRIICLLIVLHSGTCSDVKYGGACPVADVGLREGHIFGSSSLLCEACTPAG